MIEKPPKFKVQFKEMITIFGTLAAIAIFLFSVLKLFQLIESFLPISLQYESYDFVYLFMVFNLVIIGAREISKHTSKWKVVSGKW